MRILRLGLITLAIACGGVTTEPDPSEVDAGSESPDGGALDAAAPDADLTLIPSTVFVTSTGHAPDFGSRQDADQICNDLAAQARLAGNYVAWLSEGTSGAATRLPDNRSWHRVDGALVASDRAALLSGNLTVPISLDETGAPAQSSLGVYIGTEADGQAGTSGKCGNWTGISVEQVLIGSPSATDASWTESEGNCGRVRQLYCFEI